jgi:hypothetical protein
MHRLLLLIPLLLAACDTLTVPTVTPTRTLSGPTIAPTGNAIPRPPTEIPGSFEDAFGASDPTAAALPNDLDLPPLAVTREGEITGGQTVQIMTDAELPLAGNLYANVPVRAPGVLLVGESRDAWGAFPRTLEENGYTVLVIAPPPDMPPTEFSQVIGSFVDLGQGDASRLDPGRIGVIGEGAGAVVALRGCVADFRCDVLGLLSPSAADGLSILGGSYGARPLLVSASRTDPARFSVAEGLAAASLGDVLFQPFDDAGQGAAMLANRPDFGPLVLSWLANNLRG